MRGYAGLKPSSNKNAKLWANTSFLPCCVTQSFRELNSCVTQQVEPRLCRTILRFLYNISVSMLFIQYARALGYPPSLASTAQFCVFIYFNCTVKVTQLILSPEARVFTISSLVFVAQFCVFYII